MNIENPLPLTGLNPPFTNFEREEDVDVEAHLLLLNLYRQVKKARTEADFTELLSIKETFENFQFKESTWTNIAQKFNLISWPGQSCKQLIGAFMFFPADELSHHLTCRTNDVYRHLGITGSLAIAASFNDAISIYELSSAFSEFTTCSDRDFFKVRKNLRQKAASIFSLSAHVNEVRAQSLEQIIEDLKNISPQYPRAYYLMGLLEEGLGKREDAYQHFLLASKEIVDIENLCTTSKPDCNNKVCEKCDPKNLASASQGFGLFVSARKEWEKGNKKHAKILYNQAWKTGSRQAYADLGMNLLKEGDRIEALELLKLVDQSSYAKGSLDAAIHLLDSEPELAVKLLKRVAEFNDSRGYKFLIWATSSPAHMKFVDTPKEELEKKMETLKTQESVLIKLMKEIGKE